MNHFQALEARELLSMTAHSSAKPAHSSAKPAHSSAKPAPKPKIPNLVGQYSGTDTQQKPSAKPAADLSLDLTSETDKGKLAGTIQSGMDATMALTGTVNPENHFVGKFGKGATQGTLVGTFNRTTHTISGKFDANFKGKPRSGIFSVTLIT